MSTLELVGYAGILFFVLLYPLVLLRYYVKQEYVYIPPFVYGVVGGTLFYAIPYMFLKMFYGWDMDVRKAWVFIVAVAGLKALSGEGGKRLTSMVNNRSMYKWRYYLPLGIGFSYALLLSCFARPLLRLYLAYQAFSETGTPIPAELFFFGTSLPDLLLALIIMVAVVQMEVGLTVLNGLSRNRKSIRYWWLAVGLAWLDAGLILYPWESYGLRLALAIGSFLFGLFLVIRNRDAFRKYVGRQNTYRGLN